MNERQKRLIEVYEHLRRYFGIHTKTGFAEALQYGRTSMSAAMNGDEKYLTDSLFKNICAAFPDVFNLDYLLTGEGELLADSNGQMPQESQPATPTLDMSSYLNALLAKTDETIAAMKRELAAKDELIAAKDDRIADLTKLAEERLHRIAELRRIIDANNISTSDFIFPIGTAEKQTHKHI